MAIDSIPKMIAKKSFRFKLALSYCAVILVSFALVALFLDKNLEENSLANIKSSLINQARLIEGQISPLTLKQDDSPSLQNLAKTLSPRINCRITIVNRLGKVIADSEMSLQDVAKMENHMYRPEIRSALTGSMSVDTRYSSTLKINMLYAALPLNEGDETIGCLRLAIPLTSVQRTLWEVRKAVLLGLFFALVLSFLFGSLAAGRTIKQINRMIQVSRRFASGDFSRKVSLYSNDEIGELAQTLNSMAQALEEKIAEIQKQNQHLAAVFNSMIEGVIVLDKAGQIISINHAIKNIFGISLSDARGRPFLDTIRNNDIFEITNEVIGAGKFVSREMSLLLPVQKTFQINASPVFENDLVSGCLVVIHDITEIKRLETMRRDFVANVSHELKTPLTSIKGFVETLLEGALDDREHSRQFLKIIQDHAERLNNLINDLLDLSGIESKEIKLEREEFKVRDLIEETLLGLKAQLKKRNLSVNISLPDSLLVTADKARLRQVFMNLIDNAIKFNKENGSIGLSSEAVDKGIKIIVEDSGIGIPAGDLSRIFERFYRVDKARSRELGGTGLGLSIVKHIIELHGGSVGVESTEGIGSRFWFTLSKT